MGRVLLIVLFVWLGMWGLLLEGREDLDLGRRIVRGMGPELAGIVIAAVTLDALAERRQRDYRKEQLIRQLASRYRDVSEMAILELRQSDWLYDGTLRGVFLGDADLSGANLSGADLTGATLWNPNPSLNDSKGTNLNSANLRNANLSQACLRNVNLISADLGAAVLSESELENVNLVGAILWNANLERAYLHNSNLNGVSLIKTILRGASIRHVDLGLAYMRGADLSGAMLSNVNMTSADLQDVVLTGATIKDCNLLWVINWTISQLEQATCFEGVLMPNDIQLGREADRFLPAKDGPSFAEWKERYLANYGGTEEDLRDPLPQARAIK